MRNLSLDDWRSVLGYHPWHFWQLASNDIGGLQINSACNGLVYEHSWQGAASPGTIGAGVVGREQIRDAIATAKERLFEWLNFRVEPEYVVKTFQYPRPYDRRMEYRNPADATGRYLSINAKEGFIRAIGTEAFTDRGDQVIVYSDEFGGGVNDTFTVTATVAAGTLASEIEAYFISTDRLNGEGLTQRWRIEPVNVSVSGTTATLTGRAWLLVRPVLYEAWNAPQFDPTVAANFVSSLSVQRRFTDPDGITPQTAQAMLIWETDPPWHCCPCISCNTSPDFDPNDNDPAAQAFALARAVIRDARTGEIAVGEAVWDATNSRYVAVNWSTCRQPDRVQIRYLAGADENEVDSTVPYGGSWRQVIARLASAELAPFSVCSCDSANQHLWRWQFDRARAAGANSEQYQISPEDLNNPFGTREGHIYAWKQVKNLGLTRGIAI